MNLSRSLRGDTVTPPCFYAGYSDPYCEVKVNGEKKFTTGVKKKTLNPVWDEFVTLQLPKADEQLEIVRLSQCCLV